MDDPIIRAKNGDTNYFKRTPVELWAKAFNWRENQYDVLSTAIMNHHVHCSEVINRRCPELLHRQSSSGFTVLHHAVSREKTSSLIKFVISVADKKLYRMSDKWKNTPLMMSIDHNRFQAFELLVEADPDELSYVDEKGQTPLLRVLYSQNIASGRFRRLILEKQPNSSKVPTGEHQWTALHHAASRGDLGAIEDIISFCPDSVHIFDREGNTFLDIAIKYNHLVAVQSILQRKEIRASIPTGNNSGRTTLLPFESGHGKKKKKVLHETKREEELHISSTHLLLYRELVNQFGEIVPPDLQLNDPICLALGCFLSELAEIVDLKARGISQEQISNWEKMATQYTALGLQLSWFQERVARFSEWFAKKAEHARHLEEEIATKQKVLDLKRAELESLHNEVDELNTNLKELQQQRGTYNSEFDENDLVWKES